MSESGNGQSRREQIEGLITKLKEKGPEIDSSDQDAVEDLVTAVRKLIDSEGDRRKREATVLEMVRILAKSASGGKPRNPAEEIDALAERVRKIEETIEQFKVGFKVVGDNLHATAEKVKAATAKLEAEFTGLMEDLKREAAGDK